MIKKTFSEDVFETEVIVIIGTREEMERATGDMGFDGYYNGEGVIYICDDSDIAKTLSHELLHYTHHLLKDEFDISLTNQTEHTYCIFYSYYFGKIWKWIGKYKKKK